MLDIKCGLATVTGKGILFNGIYYSNANFVKSQLFAFAETQGYWFIPVLYNVNETRHLFLFGNDHLELASTIDQGNEIDPNVIQKYQEDIQRLKLMLSMQRKH
ncbi:MAG: hypothetical protein ACE3L7_00170 [Candidatus Pristimantibacillus sp.]